MRQCADIMFLICSYSSPNFPAMALFQTRGTTSLGPSPTVLPQQARGRGARVNMSGRFEALSRSLFDDGWQGLEDLPPFRTEVFEEKPKTVITRNESPDLSFDRSLNPYRGCEHGCAYCYARPAHAYMGLSPGLDFESKLFAKPAAPDLLRAELSARGYEPRTLVLGANTDCYQPVERRLGITRRILEVLAEFNHPTAIITKSALVTRDIDILAPMALKGLVKVAMSVTSLRPELARTMEPRASTPAKRLASIRDLSEAGIPATVMVAPIIPAVNDSEVEAILAAAHAAGAREAGYVMLRLPHEVKDVFADWLQNAMPDKAARVMSLVRTASGGKDYDPTFGRRQTGSGPYAWAIGRRFELACRRLGLNTARTRLSSALFQPPARNGEQLTLL